MYNHNWLIGAYSSGLKGSQFDILGGIPSVRWESRASNSKVIV